MTPAPTTLGFALLGLLHQAPQSGYGLRKVFATSALGNYSSSPGAIYPALGRLSRARLIESRVDLARALRPRRVYRPTRAGTAAFRAWLAQPVTRGDVARRMDDLMLRFASLLGLLPTIRKDKGCGECRIYRDVEDGEVFFLSGH